MKRVLVLGSKGFLGKECLRYLDNFNYLVSSPSRDELDLLNINAIIEYLDEYKTQFDLVFNFAANVGSVHYVSRLPATVISENIQISLNLYNALALKKMFKCKVVNPISNCCYPASPGQNIEGQMDFGPLHSSVQSYGAYKRALLAISDCFSTQYELKSLNVMFPGIFGPGDSIDPDHAHALNGMIVRAIQTQILSKKEFEIWGTGAPIRDWLYVEDAISSIFALLNEVTEDYSVPINVTAQNHVSIHKLARIILDSLGSDAVITFNKNYSDGVLEKVLLPGKFSTLVPNFQFTPFQSAITSTIGYLKGILDAKRL